MNTKGLTESLAKNWKALGGVMAVALVVLAVAGILNERSKAKEREATNLLFTVQTNARDLVAQKKVKEAETAYQPLLEKFPHSRAAYEASLQIGDMWMDAGNYAESVKWYQAAEKIAGDSFSRLLANYNMGIARESNGSYQEALDSYESALKSDSSDFLRPELLLAKARCFEALKQIPKALEAYEEIQKKFAGRSYYSGAASAFEKQLTQ